MNLAGVWLLGSAALAARLSCDREVLGEIGAELSGFQ